MRLGVPHWSVLGPHVFLLYTADIEKLIAHRGLSPYLYADDTPMFICCRPGNTHLLRDITLSCISNIEEWMCSNRLKLNAAKNRVLVVCHRSETPSHWWKDVHNRKRNFSTSNVCTKSRCPYGSRSVATITHREANGSMLQRAATSTSHQTFTDDGRFENAN